MGTSPSLSTVCLHVASAFAWIVVVG